METNGFNVYSYTLGIATSLVVYGIYFFGIKPEKQIISEKVKTDSIAEKFPPTPPNNDYSDVRCWNYIEGRWETYDNDKPSNLPKIIEIRRPAAVPKPDKVINRRPSEKDIEDYIEEHGEEIYEELEDEFGN